MRPTEFRTLLSRQKATKSWPVLRRPVEFGLSTEAGPLHFGCIIDVGDGSFKMANSAGTIIHNW
ncbi:hypothetical protein [Parafrankia sp. FMc2]|uniref:hypothetical protein n=1 Tax=Parafrankia sp. FMc2 TaxID=3233196 RepID=UPI0034D76CCC